ncbi:MAG TPA: response regulator [bacterium]|nr:response regulator [bacterium]
MAARILVLDDDKLILQLVKDALATDGFDVSTALSAKEAFGHAVGGKFDLVVADINLPDNSGFSFRDDLRKLPEYGKTPFIFLSAADKNVEVQIAQKLGTDRLLLKPATGADIRRAVYVGLNLARIENGQVPEAIPRIFGRVADDRETGVLTVVAGTNVKRVIFQDGKIAFAASNDPREVIGQVFVRAGLITEKDLAEAFAWRDAHASQGKKPPLGAVLTALRKVTPEQCEKVFHRKIRETVLDLFLWKSGGAELVTGALDEGDRPFPIALDTHAIVAEGLKRRARWDEVQRLLPDPTVRFEKKGGAWPKGFPANEGDRVLAHHVDAKRSMAEILVELRGQDFAVGVKLAELVRKGVLTAVASQGFSGAMNHESVTIDIDEALNSLDAEESIPSNSVEVAPSKTRVLGGDTAPRPAEKRAGVVGAVAPAPSAPSTPPVTPAPQPASFQVQPTGGAPHPAPEPQLADTEIADLPPHALESAAVPDLTVEALEELTPEPIPQAAPQPAPQPPTQSSANASTIALLTRALVLLRAGDAAGAREGLVAVLAIDPMNPLARQRLAEVDAQLAADAVNAGLGPGTKLRLAVPIHELVGKSIPANDAFMLSRLAASAMSLQELIQICPMPEVEIRKVLGGYLNSGVLKRA